MSEEKWAIITGADGGMGTEITRACLLYTSPSPRDA